MAFELGVELELVEVESRAINGYLARKFPARNLLPEGLRERALIEQWSLWQAIHLGPAMQRVAFERFVKVHFGLGQPDEAAAAASHKEALRYLVVLEARLVGRQWIVEQLSLADFALASTFMFRQPAGIALDDFPAVSAWIARVEALDSWQRAIAPLPKF